MPAYLNLLDYKTPIIVIFSKITHTHTHTHMSIYVYSERASLVLRKADSMMALSELNNIQYSEHILL
jgi:hypothetical protein